MSPHGALCSALLGHHLSACANAKSPEHLVNVGALDVTCRGEYYHDFLIVNTLHATTRQQMPPNHPLSVSQLLLIIPDARHCAQPQAAFNRYSLRWRQILHPVIDLKRDAVIDVVIVVIAA